MPKALILFGSAARGTQNEKSDIDLLAVGGSVDASSRKINGVEVQSYSEEKFFSLATSGSLFGAHIAMEGVAISDPESLLSTFRESFALKCDYSVDISNALTLCNFLHQHHSRYPNHTVVAKKVAWCVRTVLIAKLAERGKMVFSPEGLSREFDFSWVRELVELRRGKFKNLPHQQMIDFLVHFKSLEMPREISYFENKFLEAGNEVALSTIRSMQRLQAVHSSYT